MFSKLYNPTLRAGKTQMVTKDGTTTLYSPEFDEYYHSLKDGALQESLQKHIIPAFKLCKKEKLTILDICFGLGYNTLTAIYYYRQHSPSTKLHIISPEIDEELVRSLKNFKYPKEFDELKQIIEVISENFYYEDESVKIEVLIGDARDSIKNIEQKIDIVYQDAFSPTVNPALWSVEYFSDIKKIASEDIIITTYSIATPTRLSMSEAGFKVHILPKDKVLSGTIASLKKLDLQEVDMELKKQRNTEAKAYRDSDILEVASLKFEV